MCRRHINWLTKFYAREDGKLLISGLIKRLPVRAYEVVLCKDTTNCTACWDFDNKHGLAVGNRPEEH